MHSVWQSRRLTGERADGDEGTDRHLLSEYRGHSLEESQDRGGGRQNRQEQGGTAQTWSGACSLQWGSFSSMAGSDSSKSIEKTSRVATASDKEGATVSTVLLWRGSH